jgi:hypothetical protein
MRVSDAEREAAAAELREHFASGRLDQEELDERLSRAFTGKTRGDLNALFTDLPSSGTGWSDTTAPGAGPTFPPRNPWAGSDSWSQWQSQYREWRGGVGRTIGRVAIGTLLMWVLLVVGILGIFGIGAGRPFGIAAIVVAFALLRKLLMMVFGRRRAGGGGGGRRRCGW